MNAQQEEHYTVDERMMRRALQLAEFGRGRVSPNPMVGCVITFNDRIIGEGWHRNYGEAHAEVRAVEDAIEKGNEALLSAATVYVTLEPCSHFGKTPPCVDLLLARSVKRVVIGNVDSNPLVAGKGIAKLQAAGIEVRSGVLQEQGRFLNRRFFTFMEQRRPYVILKWAETADGFMAPADRTPLAISGSLSKVRVHQWRSEEDAILVGTGTALADNPRLNVREWEGESPVRVLIDRELQVPFSSFIYDRSQPTLVFNYRKESEETATGILRYSSGPFEPRFEKLEPSAVEIEQLLKRLVHYKIQSVIVEGGAKVLNAFISTGQWDEIRRCQSRLRLGEGVKAPAFYGTLTGISELESDVWSFYKKEN